MVLFLFLCVQSRESALRRVTLHLASAMPRPRGPDIERQHAQSSLSAAAERALLAETRDRYTLNWCQDDQAMCMRTIGGQARCMD